MTASGCMTVRMWTWARDRDDAEMSAYLAADGRRIAVRLDRTGTAWREYVLADSLGDGSAPPVVTTTNSASPPLWLVTWLESGPGATTPRDVFGREYLGSKNLVILREGCVYTTCATGKAVLVEDLYGATNAAATVGAVFATPIVVALDACFAYVYSMSLSR